MFFLKELPTREILENYHQKFPEMNMNAVQEALKLMHKACFLIRELDGYFASHDFSQLRFTITMVIDREPNTDSLTPGEITRKVGVSKPVMTRALKSLAKEGYAVIESHETDKRAKQVTLTDKGTKKLESILPGYYDLVERFMSKEDNYDD